MNVGTKYNFNNKNNYCFVAKSKYGQNHFSHAMISHFFKFYNDNATITWLALAYHNSDLPRIKSLTAFTIHFKIDRFSLQWCLKIHFLGAITEFKKFPIKF